MSIKMYESVCVSMLTARGLERSQEEIKTITLWEEQHPVSLAYNNIQLKKNAQRIKTEYI